MINKLRVKTLNKYDKFKDSGIEWIGEIPEHWEVNKLKYQFEFIIGFTPPSGNSLYYEGGDKIWVNISDMNNKYISDSEKKITDEAISRFKPRLLPIGSLLYSFKLSVGKVAFNKKELFTNEAIFSILPAENINLNFYYYSLPIQVIKNANKNSYGALILNKELIKNATLLIPPEQEQTAIANFLDKKIAGIDELIAKKEKLLELYEEEKAAIINQAVTKGLPNKKGEYSVLFENSGVEWFDKIPKHWKVLKLKYCFKIRSGQVDPKLDINKIKPLIAPNHIESKSGKLLHIQTAAEQGADSGKYIIKKDDVIYSKIRPELCKACISPVDGLCSADMYALDINKNVVNNLFILYFLLSDIFTLFAINESMRVAMPKINRDAINDFSIALPPLIEQIQIVRYIETEIARIDKKMYKTKKLVELLKEYKTTLISEVIKGKIKVI